MDIRGTKTERNLATAFAGESEARNKYSFYASQARKEGYNKIADFFEETARNEMAHSKMWFKLLHDGIKSTEENLKDAAAGEHYEWISMYEKFAQDAEEEGFDNIAFLLRKVGAIEKQHEQRYNELLKALEADKIFKKDETVEWRCQNCGHVHKGNEAPEICPVCQHPKAFFEIKVDKF